MLFTLVDKANVAPCKSKMLRSLESRSETRAALGDGKLGCCRTEVEPLERKRDGARKVAVAEFQMDGNAESVGFRDC